MLQKPIIDWSAPNADAIAAVEWGVIRIVALLGHDAQRIREFVAVTAQSPVHWAIQDARRLLLMHADAIAAEEDE